MKTKSRSVLAPQDLTPLLDPIPPRLEVEVGCGNGHFIASYAAQHPSCLFVGIELKAKRCLKTLKKVDAARLDNVIVICARAEDVLATLGSRTVDAFHIYFPDPWPKSRHRPRRFLRKTGLADLVERLKPEGRIYFVTDFFDYSVQAKVLMLLNDNLSVVDEAPPGQALTSVFGQRSVEWGKDIYFVTGARRSQEHASQATGSRRHLRNESWSILTSVDTYTWTNQECGKGNNAQEKEVLQRRAEE